MLLLVISITAHAATERREQPEEFGTYDCWGLKLIDSKKCSNANMVKEWADLQLFANYKTIVVATDDKGKNHKAQGGKRVMYTTHHPCWDAKNRQGLPDEMPFDFRAVEPYLFPGGQVDSPPTAGSSPAQHTPPSAQLPAAAPTAAPGSTKPTEPPPPPADNGPYIPAVLKPLLESADVTEGEVREVVAARGYYTMDTPWKVMEESGFVEGWMLPFWDKIVEMIRSNPDRLPF